MAAEQDKQLALGASDRIELLATIVMAAAAILTAWAAFQSSKWSGVQAIEYSSANAARIESTRLDTQAGQLTSIDVDVFLSWLEAVQSELDRGLEVVTDDGYVPLEGTLSAFFYERMRDEFRPALDTWLADRPLLNPDAPATPFDTGEYELEAARAADDKLSEASEHTSLALDANQNSDSHVLVAVALALAIFFAGVSSKLEARRNRWIAIALATLIFLGAAATLAALPKVSPF
ncbi:MAG: hypothetical protein PVG83_00245 [Acidimicrobiia bacterium]|jgi:hypothetical protein